MSFTTAGVRVWDSTEAASIHGASAAQAASVNDRIVSVFANEAARDAAFTSYTSAMKAGIVCWITSRQGHSFWDVQANKWNWVGVHRVLMNGNRDSAADTTASSGQGQPIILMPSTPLPPGNRLITVAVTTLVTNLTTAAATPRVHVTGTGMGTYTSGNTWISGYLPLLNYQLTLTRVWTYSLSGTCDVDVSGINSTSGGQVRFTFTRIDVIDNGPTDD